MASKNNRSLSMRRKEEEMADLETKTSNILTWIEGLLKEKLPKQPFREILLDGVVLCKLANAIKDGCIKKFHKKPRMLMMKMENIAFFLTACKARFNIPQAIIFAPTDIHDDSDPTSMRKVVNVLLLMKQEMGGGPSAAEAAAALEESEKKREQEIAELEAADIAAGVIIEPTPKPKPAPVPVEEPTLDEEATKEEVPEPEEVAEPEPEPPKPQPKAVEQPKVVEQPKAVEQPKHSAANGSVTSEFNYYLTGKIPSDHNQAQAKLVTQLYDVISSEVSLAAKIKLVAQLDAHVKAVHQKIMGSSNEELRQLAHEMGLGNSLSDVTANKERQFYVDFILKHGRAQ